MSRNVSWVVAFPFEAKSIIDRFSLKKVKTDRAIFPIYRSDDQSISLVISGLGKALSAAAVASLAHHNEQAKRGASVWINFGIAGSGKHDFGETFVASRITDQGSGRSWYPPMVWSRKIDLPRREILTVDRPESDGIEGSSLTEMEAAGFYSVATKLTTMEFCHSLKVVSDDPDHSIRDIDRARVEQLCLSAFNRSEPWLEEIVRLFDEREGRNENPQGFDEWRELAKFTVSQTHQLRKLLRQLETLGNAEPPKQILSGLEFRQGGDCLDVLRRRLEEVRAGYREG